MSAWFAKYGKVIPLFLGAIVLVVQTAMSDGVLALDEKIAIALAIVGAVNTYIVPNLSAGLGKYAKAFVQAAVPVLTGLSGWMIDGMSQSDWWALVITAATAAGVLVFPAQQHPAGGNP